MTLKTTGTRFSATHTRLLQDLVSKHGMDEHSMQTFLQRQMGCTNAGAKYWMRSVHFDLERYRGAMHAFARTVDGHLLAPLVHVDLERVRREEEATLRSSALHHAGLETRRVDAALRWGTLQWELQGKRLAADQERHWKSPQMKFVRIKQREEQVTYWTSEVGRLQARAQQLANCASWTLQQMALENAGLASAGFAQREAQARDRYLTTLQLLRTAPCHECNVAHYGDALHAHTFGGNPVDVCGSCKRYLDKGESPPCSWNSLKCCIVPPTLLRTKSCELHFVRKVHAFMMIVRLSGGQLDLKGSSIVHIADSAKMMDVLNSVPHATICLIKDGVAVTDGALYARKLQIRRACYVLRLCGHPMYADAEIVELGDEADLALHAQLPADEDAAAAIEADPQADDVSPAVPFPLDQGAPVNVAVRRHVERDVFVELFPDGRNTWSDVKDRPGMTMLKYVRSRLGSWDHRFERNMPYIFFWLNEIERQQLSSGIMVSLDFQTAASLRRSMMSSVLTADDVRAHMYPMLKKMRGTSGYWKETGNSLMRMIGQNHSATIFLTLSMNDGSWDLIRNMAAAAGMDAATSEEDLARLASKFPHTACVHFYRRLKALLRYLKESKVIGPLEDVFWRIEFQLRGSPHCHLLLWIKREYLPVGLVKLQAGEASSLTADDWNGVFQFQQSVYCARVPEIGERICGVEITPDIRAKVKEYQYHKHTPTCYKCGKGGHNVSATKNCRFFYPRGVCDEVRCATDKDKDDRKMPPWQVLTDIRRTAQDQNTNNWNPYILDIWEANIDIQIIYNIKENVNYVAKYVTKDEPATMDDLIDDVMHIQASKMRESAGSDDIDQRELLRRVMFQLSQQLLSKRTCSAQEACWRISGMPLRHLSRQTVHVNLDRPGQRKVYLPKSEIANKGVTRAVAEMDLDDKGGNVAHKVHKAYASRTDKTLNLFVYVISHMHNEKANKRDRVDPENNDDENDPCDQHEDDDDDGDDEVPKHSRKDRLISYRAYNYTSDPEGYCYAMLMLFVPWVKECDLLLKPSGDSYSSAEDAFKAHRPTIEYWLSKNEALANLFAEFTRSADAMQARTLFDDAEQTEAPPSNVDVCAQFAPLSDEAMSVVLAGGTLTEFAACVSYSSGDVQANTAHPRETDATSLTELMEGLKKNREQLAFVEAVWAWAKEKVVELKNIQLVKQGADIAVQAVAPLYLFLSGSGGTGKSFCIGAVQHILPAVFDRVSKTPIMTCAPTGAACLLISGQTLHSVMQLPVSHDRSSLPPPLHILRGKPLQRLKNLFAGVLVLIIDEISMVSRRTLEQISYRIGEATGNMELPFGGLTVIVAGDLFQLEPVGKNEAEAFTSYLWRDMVLHELFINERCKDREWSEMQNRMREHHPKFPKLTAQDIELLNSRCLDRKDSDISVLHLFCINKLTKEHNVDVFSRISRGQPTVTAYSRDSVTARSGTTQTRGHVAGRNLEQHHSETGGIPGYLHLTPGLRVMLTRSIDKKQRLVNNQCGMVLGWEIPSPACVTCVFVQFDDKLCGQDRKTKSCVFGLSAVPIYPETADYDTPGGGKVQRVGFPLVPAHACSIHKSQGMSLDTACADFSHAFARAQIYVATSRCRSREGFTVRGSKFPIDAVVCSLTALIEMKRLRERMPFEGRARRPIARQNATLPLLIDDDIIRDQIAYAQRQRAGGAVDGVFAEVVSAHAMEEQSHQEGRLSPPPEAFALAYEMLEEELAFEMTLENE